MISLVYHLSLEKQNSKIDLCLRLEPSFDSRGSFKRAPLSAAEKSALETLFKLGSFKEGQFLLSPDGAFLG